MGALVLTWPVAFVVGGWGGLGPGFRRLPQSCVGKKAVMEASNQYGRQLILSCEMLMSESRQQPVRQT